MANGEFQAYLPQSSGYAIILGGGFGFALFMLVLSWLQSKYTEMSPFESGCILLQSSWKPDFMLTLQMRSSRVQAGASNQVSFAQELLDISVPSETMPDHYAGISVDLECYFDGILPHHIPVWSRGRLVVRCLRNVSEPTLQRLHISLKPYYFSVSIIVFSVIASKVKENANGARTFLEIVRARFGKPAHIMFLVSNALRRDELRLTDCDSSMPSSHP